MNVLVTGGNGFIGSHLVTRLIKEGHNVVNIDKLTHSSDPSFMNSDEYTKTKNFLNYKHHKLDIVDKYNVKFIIMDFQPDVIYNLAAESHVARSIIHTNEFVHSNIVGLHNLLESTRRYLETTKKDHFKFIQVSTDEVYGSLGEKDPPFTEKHPFKPNTPYASTKAAGDLIIRSYFETYGFPAIVTHCTNNFGTGQHPEKFIPGSILKLIKGKSLTIHGTGSHQRDWIHVDDHVNGLLNACQFGEIGKEYLFGAEKTHTNLELAEIMLELAYKYISGKHNITHIEDRQGNDFRYAVDCSWTKSQLNWSPKKSIENDFEQVFEWYTNEHVWLDRMGLRH